MSYTSVSNDNDLIAAGIEDKRVQVVAAMAILNEVNDELGGYATRFAATITEAQGYTPTGAVEEYEQDRLAKSTTEFGTLRTAVQAMIAAAP